MLQLFFMLGVKKPCIGAISQRLTWLLSYGWVSLHLATATSYQDKKRMIRLLIEDVTLTRNGDQVDVAIRFKTGTVIQECFSVASSGQKPTDISADIIQKIEHLSQSAYRG